MIADINNLQTIRHFLQIENKFIYVMVIKMTLYDLNVWIISH